MPQNEYIERWQKLHGKRYAPLHFNAVKTFIPILMQSLGWIPTRRLERRPPVKDTRDRRMHRTCVASEPRCSSSSAIRRRSRCGRESRRKRSATSSPTRKSSRRRPCLITSLTGRMQRTLKRCLRRLRIGGMRRRRNSLSPFLLSVVSRRRRCLRLLLLVKRLRRRLGSVLSRSRRLLGLTLREGRPSMSGLFGMYPPLWFGLRC